MTTEQRIQFDAVPRPNRGDPAQEAAKVLLGRAEECRVIDRLLSAARSEQGSTLVLHGEPGIGKSALLAYAAESAAGFQLLRAVGNDAEAGLAYAAAQQLCAAHLSALERLPKPQRTALGVAFGQVEGSPPDQLLVGLALLGLLSQLASEAPVLCVIDDAQWLDHESAQAFAIVARRVSSKAIAIAFGARTLPEVLAGIKDLPLTGLGKPDARTLLRSALPDPFDESVVERIIAETRGNPLALLELPRGQTRAELAGGFALPRSLPVAGRLQESFRRRMTRLPAPSRRLLLLAAADPTGDPLLIWLAAQKLGIAESAALAVEADGLLHMAPRVIFRHPLVRSAVYEAASPADRRTAHRALAEATDPDADPDRRAWHRAQATWHPDDEVAAELEVSAGRAQARGGIAASAAFLQRAAELTLDPKQRFARTLAAAKAKRQAGALDAALELAFRAERSSLDDHQRAQLDVLRGEISFASQRGRDAPQLLLAAAQRLELHDPRRARDTYLDAMTAALFAGNQTNAFHARDVARAALGAAPACEPVAASDQLLQGLALLVAEGPASGTPVAQQALERFRTNSITPDEALRWSWLAGRTAAFVWDYETWDALTSRQVEVALATGALSVLPLTLSTTAGVKLFAGRLAEAESHFEQAEAVADATDTRTAAYAAVLIAAFRGHELEAREFIAAAAKDFAARGEGMGVTLTRCAEAALGNGLAQYDEAYLAAERALEDPYELWFWTWATVELIEAASRTGRVGEAIKALERLSESTGASGTPWGSAVEDRCRALLSQGSLAEGYYRSAINSLRATRLRLDLARTHLLFGEWLRRENRSADAREQLRAAHELFTEFGSHGYAERARIELRATGDRVGQPAARTTAGLAPQEARVAELVAQGHTNAEIAAHMFISPSTVEYHLHKVFRKLGVKSRTQVARHVLESAQG